MRKNLTLDNLASHPAIIDIKAIPRITSPSPQFMEQEILKDHSPIIISNNIANQYQKTWTIENLCEMDGNAQIPLEYSLYNYYQPNVKINGGQYFRKIMSLANALELISNPQKMPYHHYISSCAIEDFLPNFAKKIEAPGYFSNLNYKGPVLFIGNNETGTQLHYDATENLLRMYKGKKRVLLIAPLYTHKLYPIDIRYRLLNFSRVDFLAPENITFKKCKNIKVLYGLINEGETLYIPAGWWHQIQNQHLAMGVSYIWHAKLQTKFNWQQLRYTMRRYF